MSPGIFQLAIAGILEAVKEGTMDQGSSKPPKKPEKPSKPTTGEAIDRLGIPGSKSWKQGEKKEKK